jgi:hypothetical protein
MALRSTRLARSSCSGNMVGSVRLSSETCIYHVPDIKDGTISIMLPLHTTSLLFIVGGGRSPLYPPNKVVLWDESKGKAVAELEFRERVRGLSCRRNWLVVALRHRIAVFQFAEESITKFGEWDTFDNPRGSSGLTMPVSMF